MPIKATEVGKIFRYATGFDLSGAISIELKFHAPDGTINTVTSPRLTAPAVEVQDPDLGTLPASTYMEFITTAADFPDFPDVSDSRGYAVWTVCGTYEDTTPKKFFGDDVAFNVYLSC